MDDIEKKIDAAVKANERFVEASHRGDKFDLDTSLQMHGGALALASCILHDIRVEAEMLYDEARADEIPEMLARESRRLWIAAHNAVAGEEQKIKERTK